jgi:hypothetical protein
MSETMSYRVVEEVGLVLHSEQPPSVHEWDAMLKGLEADILGGRIKGVFVYTVGGAPSPTQRKGLTELYNRCPKPPQVAVVSPKMAIRAVVTVINWFQRDPTHRVFAPNEVGAALEFMGVAPSRRSALEAAVQAGMKRLNCPSTALFA